jgi:methionyl-tRNA formyltransferase
MKTIIFYGRTQVGAVVLSYLVAKGFKVKVIPEDDLIRNLCKYYNLKIVNLENMGKFDLFICCHGEKIIDEKYLVPDKFINMHSCLWKYKGKDPIGRYIKNKDTNASIESHFLVKDVDMGKVINRVLFKTPVIKSYGEYFNLAIPYYFQCIDETLRRLLE